MFGKVDEKELLDLARRTRKDVWQMVYSTKSSHVGSAFSIVEILVVLYKLILKNNHKNPDDAERDRLILSKGHACSALYAILAELGYFPKELLDTYAKNNSILMSHVNSEVPGVEFSTGSLGHGLPVSLGMALAAKSRGEAWRTFTILSDGELNEGSNWEAFAMAAHLKMDNLFVIIDCNKLQAFGFTKDVVNLDPLEKKFEAFNWEVMRIDGHDFSELYRAFTVLSNSQSGRPKLIIADTIKGRGVSFIENKLEWHYRWPSDEEYQQGLIELG
ncbi:TPA: transketolase [Candidatus Falkowbacteria bacterium]|nr:MAG: Transketolase, N-subunit [Candidatus Falkowbacteria bacterium GW2011_GWF2_43_32]HBA36498.1 transketolase [Candidatus Falkowbacteria bacterium]